MTNLRSLLVWTVLTAVALGVGVSLVSQRFATLRLRSELESARGQRQEFAELSKENEKLRARQISPVELDALRADHVAMVRMRRELELLKNSRTRPGAQP